MRSWCVATMEVSARMTQVPRQREVPSCSIEGDLRALSKYRVVLTTDLKSSESRVQYSRSLRVLRVVTGGSASAAPSPDSHATDEKAAEGFRRRAYQIETSANQHKSSKR